MNTPTPTDTSFIGIVTDKIIESRDFYTKHFAYTINHEKTDFICLHSPDGKRSLGFISPSQAESSSILSQPFSGQGIYLTFSVPDADASLEYFRQNGVPISRGIKTESRGERLFMISDPNGVGIYISQHA